MRFTKGNLSPQQKRPLTSVTRKLLSSLNPDGGSSPVVLTSDAIQKSFQQWKTASTII